MKLSMNLLTVSLTCLCVSGLTGCNKAEESSDSLRSKEFALVKDGNPEAVIVLPVGASDLQTEAATFLQRYIEKASGVKLAIMNEGEEKTTQLVKIYVGSTQALATEGVKVDDLPTESFGIKIKDQKVFLFGRDEGFGINALVPQRKQAEILTRHWSASRTPATKWAVNRLVEKSIGVKWLWPGDLGTFVPRKKTIKVTVQDEVLRPLLERRFYMAKGRLISHDANSPAYIVDQQIQETLQAEARNWLEDHQAGNRINLFYGHSFSDWWEKYSATNPDLFAVPPSPEFTQPFPSKDRVKLRLANPAVLDVIEKEYLAAGKPPTWSVTPNDGSGFDTSPETSAWDIPANQNKMEVWRAQGNLSARYIRFWNLVYERLKKHNPEVRLSTLAYSCYRQAPSAETPVTANLIVGIVNGYKSDDAYEAWKGWSDHGAKMVLRPNWWHYGVHAPYLEPYAQAKYVKFAAANGMIVFSADSILGYWATQGLNYYVVARMVENPSLDPEAVIGEYTSAFGAAEPKIREYLDYWFDWSQKVNYEGFVPTVGAQDPQSTSKAKGLYQEVVDKYGLGKSVLTGSFRSIPYLYEDDSFTIPEQLLKEAHELAKADGSNPEALRRVEFLQAGLQEFRLTSKTLKVGYEIKEKKNKTLIPEFRERADELRKLRTELTRIHALWGEPVYENEVRRKIPTSMAGIPELKEELDGL